MGIWNLGDYFLDSRSSKRSQRTATRNSSRRLSRQISRRRFECLESRQMLAITAMYDAGTMTESFIGTSPTDLLELSIVGSGDAISFDIGGGAVTQMGVANVTFSGAGGATRFIIHGLSTADMFTFTNVVFPGVASDHINFLWLGVQKVFVEGGDGADTFNVLATGTETHILGEGDDDIVNVSSDAGMMPGNQGNLEGIAAPLFVDGGIGANTMVVSDYGEALLANTNVTVNANEIDNFAGPTNNIPIQYAATGGTLALELDGSNSAAAMFGDKFNVIATAPNVHLTLKGNAGDDFFFVGNVLSNITGAVRIVGGGDAGDATQIDDTGRDIAVNYVVTSGISVDGHTIVDGFDTANLELDGTTGENHFTVTPNHVTKFLIDGKAPEPGDSLTVNIAGTAGAQLTLDPMTPGSGKWTFTDGTMEVDFKNITTEGIEAILAYGAAASKTSQPIVKIVDAATGVVTGLMGSQITAYASTFKGGVHVALGDVDGDGIPDLIAAPGRGLEPTVKVFNLLTGALIEQFDVYGIKFRGGVNVALGDLNHDGKNDLVVSPTLGKAVVQTFINTGMAAQPFGPLGTTLPHATAPVLTPTTQFLAFSPNFLGGATVVVNDVLLTGTGAQIIVGSGPGTRATVNVFPGNATGSVKTALVPLTSFNPFVTGFRGGVTVASMGALVTVGAGIGGHSTFQEWSILPGSPPTVSLTTQISSVFLNSIAPLQVATNSTHFVVAQGNDAPSITSNLIGTPNFSGSPPYFTQLLADPSTAFAGGFYIALDVNS